MSTVYLHVGMPKCASSTEVLQWDDPAKACANGVAFGVQLVPSMVDLPKDTLVNVKCVVQKVCA